MKKEEFDDIMSTIGVTDPKERGRVVELNDDIEADIVYENKSRTWLKLLWIVPLTAVLIGLFITVIYISQVRFVPAHVVGAEYTVGRFSVVPDNYKPNTSNILPGNQVVIKTDSDPFFGPFITKYEIKEVKEVKDLTIKVVKDDDEKNLKTIPIFDVQYVLKSTNQKNQSKDLSKPENRELK